MEYKQERRWRVALTAIAFRKDLRDLQKKLKDRLHVHMAAGPGGDKQFVADLDAFVKGDEDYRVQFPGTSVNGCIWANGTCPPWTPVCCLFCARHGVWRWKP